MSLFRRQPHPRRPQRHQLTTTIRIEGMERLVAAIADLAPATAALTAAVTSAVDVLTAPPSGDTTVLSSADQATLDAAVAAVQEATANLNAALPPAAPVETPVEGEPTGDGTEQPTA